MGGKAIGILIDILSFWLFFRGLTNLVDLDLSGNALTSVPSPAVADCKYLMRLSLRLVKFRYSEKATKF